jgi:Fe-S cluster biosynthesis and repair protein YggX
MADQDTRIDQFRKMATDDPDNELGHFSLGRALLDAGRPADAVPSFERVLQLSPTHSAAHLHLGQALAAVGRRDEAVARFTAGAAVAHDRGDVKPRNEMARLLGEMGAPVPTFAEAARPQQAAGQGEVVCRRCGKVGRKLAKPPFKGEFGQQVFDQICYDCWQLAIRQGTKVINELRLPLNDPSAQKMWDQHIKEFLNLQS